MLAFTIEPLAACWNEMLALASQHWQETMQWQHGKQPLCPVVERYQQFESAGWFVQFMARDQGTAVGYAGMYLTPSMHTQQLIASEDTIFLLPSHRTGRNALRFFQFIEATCWERGAREIGATAKPNHAAGRLLAYMGLTLINHQYSKHRPPEADSFTMPVKESDHVFTETTGTT